MTHLYVFGDSIAQGAWDPFGGWVQRVRTILDQTFFDDPDKECLTFNMGVSGNTSDDILKRFQKEMKARVFSDEKNMIIFAMGINDSLVFQETGLAQISVSDFESNLTKLYKKAKKYSDRICFVGLNPVHEKLVNPLPWAPEKSYWNSSIQQYNEIIKGFCAEENIKFIDIWQDWINESYHDWLFDGIHPNAAGHQRIAGAVLSRFLKPAGWFIPDEDEEGYIRLK